MILMGGSIVLLLIDLVIRRKEANLIAFVLVLLLALSFCGVESENVVAFSDTMAFDPLQSIVRMILIGALVWVAVYPGSFHQPMEYYFLLIGVLVGSLFLISVNNLLMAYLALELTSFSSYIVTNFNFKKRSFEAGLKYLLFGGISSATTLYGISLIYGMSGSLTLSQISFTESDPVMAVATILVLAGIFFKTSIIPFHIWVPSTYEEAPTGAVAVFSIIPKVAGFLLLKRLTQSPQLRLDGQCDPDCSDRNDCRRDTWCPEPEKCEATDGIRSDCSLRVFNCRPGAGSLCRCYLFCMVRPRVCDHEPGIVLLCSSF